VSGPVFKVGDPVECESSYYDNKKPRWNFEEDQGGSGKYIQGKVRCITGIPPYLEVRLNDGVLWQWPLPGHDRYSSSQWGRPGYLRRITDASGKYSIIRHPGKWRLVSKDGYTILEKISE